MTKPEQFLWAVQTIVVCNAINLSLEPKKALPRRHIFSASGTIGLVEDALYASTRIPESMSASQAADEFCGWMLEDLREPGDEVPAWFARF